MMSSSVAPPSPQEIQQKLSVHSVSKSKAAKPPSATIATVSGTESESDSGLAPDTFLPSGGRGGSSQQPLSSIAEGRSGIGEESEEEEEEVGWKTTGVQSKARGSIDESVIKAGYLWKKGERRKTWKKRWFVLRPAHLAYYKTSAEYKLLRLLDLSEVHSCTKVNLKKHENTFGLVSPVRTFYLQAASQLEVQEWVDALEEARRALMATSTQNSLTNPIPIPNAGTGSDPHPGPPVIPSSPGSHPTHVQSVTSSDSDEPTVHVHDVMNVSPPSHPVTSSPHKSQFSSPVDPAKTIVSGYLMKCDSKRKNWRKRWFVLTSEKLVYSRSHMDTKPHRIFPFSEILDGLEYDLPDRYNTAASTSPSNSHLAGESEDTHRTHTFKIVTTKRTLLLCAPSEEEEIRWLGAVRALIARRTDAGMVPGESKANSSLANPDVVPSGSGGLRGKARRGSASADDGNWERKS